MRSLNRGGIRPALNAASIGEAETLQLQSSGFEELLTYPQVAEKLKLKRAAVERLVAARKIPVIRLNSRCLRFRWSDVEAALKKLTVWEVR
jgi:excisionase family DNA binding protein